MSNLIKYPYVNMQGKEAKVICYESEEEKFQPLDAKKKVVMKTFEGLPKKKKREHRRRPVMNLFRKDFR